MSCGHRHLGADPGPVLARFHHATGEARLLRGKCQQVAIERLRRGGEQVAIVATQSAEEGAHDALVAATVSALGARAEHFGSTRAMIVKLELVARFIAEQAEC